MKERKPNQTPKVAGLSAVCVILTLILVVLLLASVTLRQHVMQTEAPKAASVVQLDKMTVTNSDGKTVSLPKLILDEYIQDDRITEEQIGNVLREGTFRYTLGDKVNEYNAWLASGGKNGDFPEITVDECIDMLKGNSALLYKETGLRFLSEDEAKLRSNLEAPLSDLNAGLSGKMEKGFTAILLKGSIAGWFWIIPAVLLLAVLVWLIVIHVRGGRSAGKAIRAFSTAACIPCMLLLLWGAVCVWIPGAYQDSVKQMQGTWLICGGLGILGCAALFGIGMIWKLIAEQDGHPAVSGAAMPYDPADTVPQKSPEPETSAPEKETATQAENAEQNEEQPQEEQKAIRRFCRFCGQPLVNNDAKFCYKCGKSQEKTASKDSE